MRYFTHEEPGPDGQTISITVSEEDIRRDFYPDWLNRMNKKFGEELVRQLYGFPDCLMDWQTIHWARESTL